MALESTLIAKIGGGLVAVGTTSGAGVYAYQSGFFKDFFSSSHKYVIAKSSSHTVDSIGELYSGSNNTKTSNFKCSLKEAKITDDKCQIVELIDTDKHLSLILASKKETSAATIKTNDKYFKIILSDELLIGITKWDKTEEIQIEHKDTEGDKKGKIFGKLKAHYLVENGKVTKGETNLIIAKAIKTDGIDTSVTDITAANCMVDLKGEKKPCSIYSFNKKPVDFENKKNEIDISGVTAITSTNITTLLADNDFFVIDLKEANKQDISKLTDKTIVYLSKDDKVIKNFIFVGALSTETTFTTSTPKPLILA